ncbi:hypothetical protein [Alicyclobacillus sp. SP_1]|uniref:hypothetical protein n=1 Tax=Alicyclobacillus sp. SP_1 TaxID=2942475 RepID=UPI002157B31C|nr:hypothetical protein [Alicyclobacillus sp. SP_1]
MNWSLLLLLLCPLTMVFCMGSLFRSPKKQAQVESSVNVVPVSQDELKTLQLQVADLMIENHELKAQVQRQQASLVHQDGSADGMHKEIRMA